MIHRLERIYESNETNFQIFDLDTYVSSFMTMYADGNGTLTVNYIKISQILGGDSPIIFDIVKNGISQLPPENRINLLPGTQEINTPNLAITVVKGDRLDLRIISNPRVPTFASVAGIIGIDDGSTLEPTRETIELTTAVLAANQSETGVIPLGKVFH